MSILSVPNALLCIIIVGGCLVLLSYFILLPRTLPSRRLDPLWFGIQGTLRTVYYVSILCSAIVFFCSLYWIYHHLDHQNIQSYTNAYILLLLSAMLWAVALWWWGHHPSTVAVWSVCMTLIGTTIGSMWLLYNTYLNNAPQWVLLCLVYFVFHVFVLDNIGWFYAFYRYHHKHS